VFFFFFCDTTTLYIYGVTVMVTIDYSGNIACNVVTAIFAFDITFLNVL